MVYWWYPTPYGAWEQGRGPLRLRPCERRL